MAGDERCSWGLCFVSNLSKLIYFILNESCSEQINFSWDRCLSVWTKITSGLHSVNIHLSPWVEMYAGERINNRCSYKTHDREAAARWKMMCAANLRDRLQLYWLELRMWFLIFFYDKIGYWECVQWMRACCIMYNLYKKSQCSGGMMGV